MFAKALLSLALLALPTLAQTYTTNQNTIESCSASFFMEDYPESEVYTFSTTDTSAYTAHFKYDPQYCSQPSGVVRFRAGLTDSTDNTLYTCTFTPFDNTGSMTITCSATKRRMAIAAKRDGHIDWALTTTAGQRPATFVSVYEFGVEGTGPVPSAGIAERRSWRDNLRRSMECPVGQAMCPTGVQGRSECRDVTNDIYSCGACPGASAQHDCTEIEGAEDVECRAGACHVKTCAEGWRVSSNSFQCIPSFLTASATR